MAVHRLHRVRTFGAALLCASAFLVAVGAPQIRADSISQVPGTFVVSVKGQIAGSGDPSTRQFARLAIDSFRQPSSDPTFMDFRMDDWEWGDGTNPSDVVSACQSGSLIGHDTDGTDPNAPDATKSLLCAQKALGEPTQTRWGTYCGPSPANPSDIEPGDIFTIYWHDTTGNTTAGCSGPYYERWRYLPQSIDGGNLSMIEMLGASNVDLATTFYAKSDGTYDPAALDVGWGFGSRGEGPRGGVTLNQIAAQIIGQGLVYQGYYKRWNNWCTTPSLRNESVKEINTASRVYPWKLTNGTYQGAASPKLRTHEPAGVDSAYDIYSYMSVPDGQQSSFTNRRINVDVSNDFNENGYITDDFGHTQSGLQIIDATGAFVGYVSLEIGHNDTTANGGYDTFSAMYFIRSDLTPTEPVGTVSC